MPLQVNTPTSQSVKSNVVNPTSLSKKKQLSLMSFFTPAPKKQDQARGSPDANQLLSTPQLASHQDRKQKVMPINGSALGPSAPAISMPNSVSEATQPLEKLASKALNEFSASAVETHSADRTALNLSPSPLDITNDTTAFADSSPISLKSRSATRKKNYIEPNDSESDDEPLASRFSNKRRKIIDSDDDEDKFIPSDNSDDQDSMDDFVAPDEFDPETDGEAKASLSLDSESEPLSMKKPPQRVSPKRSSKRPDTNSHLSKPASKSAANPTIGKFNSTSNYQAQASTQRVNAPSKPLNPPAVTKRADFAKENEERYLWLVNVRDSEKRLPDDDNYDPRTLYIPQSAWSKFTAFEKQYWEIKSKMWNTVVFFKKGKFYELYENDARVANCEFDLKIAGGGRANMQLAGIPEMSFQYWAKEFISHGYKVARVDQKESMLAKEMRGGGSKEEKIIKRELTGVLTAGTLTDMDMISGEMATYCMAIKQDTLSDGSPLFGVAFVDTATSEVNLIEFVDDPECTMLDSLIAQTKPTEIICKKHNLSAQATKIIKFTINNGSQIWNTLNPNSEFWDYDTTIGKLVHSKYYDALDLDDYSQFPPVLVDFKDNHRTGFTAFGGLLFYLKSLMLDETIMTLANIHAYSISRGNSSALILDGATLNNLEIFNNSYDGSDRGTLFKLINRAITPFGRRTLKEWLMYPLFGARDINKRLDTIDYLLGNGLELKAMLEQTLTGLPDLERLLARVHAKLLPFKDFLRVIESFERIKHFMTHVHNYTSDDCGAINELLSKFPSNLSDLVDDWEDAFDRLQAEQGIIVPGAGVDEQFDESLAKLSALEDELNRCLKEYKSTYKSQEIIYRDSGKECFLIEIPIKLVKNVPNDWQQMGSTAKVRRYWSPEVKDLTRSLMEQRELHKMVCETLRTRMYERFDSHYKTWRAVIKLLANIDCLLSLTRTSESMGSPSCRPEFIEGNAVPGSIEFKDVRHPCFIGAKDFIPNDVLLGGDESRFALLTGANAAGKSTIMRTTSLAIILAQLGCHVPASSARLTPIDRIMTRLGANDNIMQGKSTFFVELSETKKILSNATPRLLVILDELGRGGSSSDGYAIAEAVLHHLATHTQPLGFFATHYGSLGSSFKVHPQIRPLRMGIMVDAKSRNITFLYKLEDGAAAGSFGMNVASMCGIAESIVAGAEVAAKQYEQTSHHISLEAHAVSLGAQSDFVWYRSLERCARMEEQLPAFNEESRQGALCALFGMAGKM